MAKRSEGALSSALAVVRRLPTLPHLRCSTIGVDGLNCSVRNGKRWDPIAITTQLCGFWRCLGLRPDFRLPGGAFVSGVFPALRLGVGSASREFPDLGDLAIVSPWPGVFPVSAVAFGVASEAGLLRFAIGTLLEVFPGPFGPDSGRTLPAWGFRLRALHPRGADFSALLAVV